MASISVINIADMKENSSLDEVFSMSENKGVQVAYNDEHSTVTMDALNMQLKFDSNAG